MLTFIRCSNLFGKASTRSPKLKLYRYNTSIMAKQSDPTKRFEDNLIDAKVAVPLVITIGIVILFAYLTGQTYSQNIWLVGGFVIGSILFALTHFIPQLQFTKRHGPYLIMYHVVLAALFIFIVPSLSIFLIVWVLLAYLSDFYYRRAGLALSLSWLLFTLIAGISYQSDWHADHLLQIIPWFALVIAIVLVLSHVILGNRQERQSLGEKMLRAEYEHERMLALINSMTEAVLAIEQDGTIALYNAAALDLLDTNVELTGRNIHDVLPVMNANGQSEDILDIAAATHYLQRRDDLYLQFGPDDKVALEINISRTSLVSNTAQQQGYTFLLRDITQQKSLDEERDEFISVVSHELRTPITVAEANISMAQLLANKKADLPAEIKDSLEKAHRQVIFLSEMVNDLSTLSRAERNDKEMEVETFSVQDILTELEATYRPQAEKKGLHLNVKDNPDLPKLTTSRLYVKEILQNFLTNAIKYTQQGSVEVWATYEDGKQIRISVKDSGIGIAKSEQDHVYDKFWRSEDPLTRQTSGTGLGLYITAKLARRLGAQLDMQSALKQGTTFSLILPVVAVQPVDTKNVVKNEVETAFS